MKHLIRVAGAEFIGTALVTAGPIAWGIYSASSPNGTLFDASLVSALPVVIAIFLFRDVSAQFNPAVTLWLVLTKRIKGVQAIIAWISQFTGASVIALVMKMTSGVMFAGLTLPHVSLSAGAIIECCATLGLLAVIRRVTTPGNTSIQNDTAPWIIALSVAGLIIVTGPLTCGSMNPARSFGPALAAGHYNSGHQLIYFVGPLMAAVVLASLEPLMKRWSHVPHATDEQPGAVNREPFTLNGD